MPVPALKLCFRNQAEKFENHRYTPKRQSMALNRGWHIQIEEDQNISQNEAGGLEGYSNCIERNEL